MSTTFKLSSEEKKIEKMARGAGFLITGLILFFGAGSFLFQFWPRLEFLIKEGEHPQMQQIDLTSTSPVQAELKDGFVEITGYPGPLLYRDYQATITDNFRSMRFVYLPLFSHPVSQPIREKADGIVFLQYGVQGYFGLSPLGITSETKPDDLPPGEKATLRGVVGYTDGGDITNDMRDVARQYGIELNDSAVFVQEDTPPTWERSGVLVGTLALLTVFGLYCFWRSYKYLKNSIL